MQPESRLVEGEDGNGGIEHRETKKYFLVKKDLFL